MADIVKLEKDGYGQLELNNVAFRRDGRIEAQAKLNITQFPANSIAIGGVAENGMLFAIDNTKRELKKATTTLAADHVIGLNYSSEHMYDERKPGLKNFFLQGGEDFLPRLGLLAVGDKFHTNTVCYSDDDFEDEDAIIADLKTKALFAGIAADDSGYWQVFDSAPAVGPVARVLEYATMPDGQPALKLQVIKA